MNKVYTVNQVAEMLQLNPVTILRYIAQGRLSALKFGGVYRITDKALEEFMERASQ